ncbi:MAG: endonuclease/exonuclease/phosphatase family protein [Cyanobacteria bacterium P01_D01_bin.44]
MLIVSANLWCFNPARVRAIRQCLKLAPEIIVLLELQPDLLQTAEQILTDDGFTLTHTRTNDKMLLGIASRAALHHHEVIDDGSFAGRPQLKLQLETGLTFFGIHLMAPVTPRKHSERQKQLRSLAPIIAQTQGPVALAGDFNTYFSEPIFQQFLQQSGCSHSSGVIQQPRSWPSLLPLFKIDHILCNQHLQITQSRSGRFNGSDHLPIMAQLETAR